MVLICLYLVCTVDRTYCACAITWSSWNVFSAMDAAVWFRLSFPRGLRHLLLFGGPSNISFKDATLPEYLLYVLRHLVLPFPYGLSVHCLLHLIGAGFHPGLEYGNMKAWKYGYTWDGRTLMPSYRFYIPRLST